MRAVATEDSAPGFLAEGSRFGPYRIGARIGRGGMACFYRAEHLGLKIGDDVVHAQWGEGVVVDIIGSGDRAEVAVRFPGLGEKRLLLAWAQLKRA